MNELSNDKKEELSVGDYVAPREDKDLLYDSWEQHNYGKAIIASLDPFFLISECGKMTWLSHEKDFEKVGEAEREVLIVVMERLSIEYFATLVASFD